MQLCFELGEQERHQVTFSFDKIFGRLTISVDGKPVKRDVRVISLRLVKRYEFPVGTRERHIVVIEKERKLLFAGFRSQICRAYVDGVLLTQTVA